MKYLKELDSISTFFSSCSNKFECVIHIRKVKLFNCGKAEKSNPNLADRSLQGGGVGTLEVSSSGGLFLYLSFSSIAHTVSENLCVQSLFATQFKG